MSPAVILLIVAWVFCLIWIPYIIYSNKKTNPKALFILFFAEMWERFSYYGMRALLTLYMAQVLFVELGRQLAEQKSLAVYGSYTSLVYLFPVIGGLIADRYFGFRKAIITGGILMMLGHFALALEGMIFQGDVIIFNLSLALIIVGNAYFKPNISSFLGQFYEEERMKLKKDGAFNIFYVGINAGAFLSSVTCGYVGQEISWHYGFGLAGIGMLVGLLVFYFNQGALQGKGKIEEAGRKKIFANLSVNTWILIATIVLIPIVSSMLQLNEVFTTLLLVAGLGIIAFMIIQGFLQKDKVAGQRLWVVLVLFIFNVIFWALFEQAGGSLTLFTENNVDRTIGDGDIPASMFQALNAFFILIFATGFTWIWNKLRKRNLEPSTPMKFVLGLVQLALGFGIVVLASKFFATDGLIPMIFIVLMYMFHTTGELSLSPVGLSMITKLSPKKIVGMIMGVWFVSFALANKLAGKIGEWTAKTELPESATAIDTLNVYTSTYLNWGVYVVLASALLLLLLVPLLRKWMNGIH
ncbi:MAG: peptide MFS transporter [Bacteroidota bacterium]